MTRRVVVLLVAVSAVAQLGAARRACGQASFQVRPLFSAAEVYESNLWSTPSGAESDLIARFTAGVESTWRSPLWRISGDYAADAERYARHSTLTTPVARQQAGLTMTTTPTARLTIAGRADFLSTRDAQELNGESGLTFTRARARRFSGQTSLARELTPLTSGTLEYAFSADSLGDVHHASVHAAAARMEHRLSPRTSVTGRYRVHRFAFGQPEVGSLVISHALTVGVTRAIAPRLTLALEAGPRATGGGLRPELSGSIVWAGTAAYGALSYARTQATVIGLAGAADVEGLQASYARSLGRSLDVRVAPGLFRSALGGLHADVYVLSLSIVRQVGRMLLVELATEGTLQRGSLYATFAGQTISRHRALLRLRAPLPAVGSESGR